MRLHRRLERLEARLQTDSSEKEEWLYTEAFDLLTDEQIRIIEEALRRRQEEGHASEFIDVEELTDLEAEAFWRLEEAREEVMRKHRGPGTGGNLR